MERATVDAATELLIRSLRLLECRVCRHGYEAVELSIYLLDPLQKVARNGARRDSARAKSVCHLADAPVVTTCSGALSNHRVRRSRAHNSPDATRWQRA